MMTVIVFKDYWKNSTQGQFWGENKEEKKKKRVCVWKEGCT